MKEDVAGSVPILDYSTRPSIWPTTASTATSDTRNRQRHWRTLMWHGRVLQMIVELKRAPAKVTDTAAPWKQINYYTNSQDRMDYGRYRDTGRPIGNGLVEGQCKFLVARLLKGNGMRWRPLANGRALHTPLAVLNGDLTRYFSPPADCEIVAA